MDKSTELKNCHFVKAILMLLIVLYHSMVVFAGWGPIEISASSEVLKWLSLWIQYPLVYAFTLVSGYIFYYLKIEKGRYPIFGTFLKNKFLRLMVPYLFVLICWVVPFRVLFYGAEGLVQNMCWPPLQANCGFC